MTHVSDEAAITALVHAYVFLVDDGDVDGVAALFAHATWRSDASDAVRRGAAEVRPVYEQLRASTGDARTKHLITNLTVTVEEGATTASSRCYWTVVSQDPDGGIRIARSGQYVDSFAKVDGIWRFADRLITVDLGGR